MIQLNQYEMEINEIEDPTRQFKVRWTPPFDLPYFSGHFPDRPILPAVAIIDFSVEALRRSLKLNDLALKAVRSAKFMHPILPNTSVQINLTQTTEKEWQITWVAASSEIQPDLLAHLTFLF